jgi:3-phenylpropionate/trans-cinnamate dioxygenase ferredoxin component
MTLIERWLRRARGRPGPEAGELVLVCAVGDLAVGEIRRIQGLPLPIAVCRTSADGFYAFSDACPHRGLSLSEGMLSGDVVHCPFHGGAFSVRGGRAVSGPTRRRLRMHRVLVLDGEVYVSLSAGVPVCGLR